MIEIGKFGSGVVVFALRAGYNSVPQKPESSDRFSLGFVRKESSGTSHPFGIPIQF
jgi:hypothetical protein